MGFRQRVVAWSITGLVQHVVLIGLVLASALVLVAVVVVGSASLATRIALPMVDSAADRRWSDALAPLSTVAERYPPVETNDTARRLETIAASMGIWLDATGNSRTAEKPAEFVDPDVFEEAVELLLAGEPPVWEMDVADCVGASATSEHGHLQLQRLLLSTARRSLDAGRDADASRILEASWQLNDSLLRSPRLASHRSACSIVEQEMSLLRELPDLGEQWRLRLASLDLERHALEAYRFEAWRARCLAGSFLSDVHPVLVPIGQPMARLLTQQQNEAMLFAVRELPRRDIRSFDPDAFVAEQHARVPRSNRIARASLPRDWTSWPTSVRAALDVELALRVIELRAFHRGTLGRGDRPPQPRQPSRVPGVDWLYESRPGLVTIRIDSSGWPAMAKRPLVATVSIGSAERRGAGV